MLGWAEEIVDAIKYKPGWSFKLDKSCQGSSAPCLLWLPRHSQCGNEGL